MEDVFCQTFTVEVPAFGENKVGAGMGVWHDRRWLAGWLVQAGGRSATDAPVCTWRGLVILLPAPLTAAAPPHHVSAAQVVALRDGGEGVPVTEENRREFVDLYVDFWLNGSVHKQVSVRERGVCLAGSVGGWGGEQRDAQGAGQKQVACRWVPGVQNTALLPAYLILLRPAPPAAVRGLRQGLPHAVRRPRAAAVQRHRAGAPGVRQPLPGL